MRERSPLSVGERFGRLVVVKSVEPLLRGGKMRPAYLVRCDCGTEKVAMKQTLRAGSYNCGCAAGEVLREIWLKKNPRHLCIRTGCHEPVHKMRFCIRHYRFNNMRSRAARSKKLLPTFDELEAIVPKSMICRICKRQMNWLQKDGAATVMSLQHNRDGSLEMICLSCNVRHHSHPGDSFYDVDQSTRRCTLCRAFKPHDEFPRYKGKHWMGRANACKPCHNDRGKRWREANPERAKQLQRAAYLRQKKRELEAEGIMTRPMMMDEWIGKTVRLLGDIETRGGENFKKGDELVVETHWRGKLTLLDPAGTDVYCQGRRSISHVERHLVEIVEA